MLSDGEFAGARILVLGDVALDRFIYGDAARISPEAPVPVLRVRAERSSAGCAANVSANVAALGGHATVVGVVGDDAEAAQLKGILRQHAAALAPLLVTDGRRPTTVKTRFVAGGQQVMRADDEEVRPIGRLVENRVLDLYSEALPGCHVVIVSDYRKGALTDRVLSEAIARAAAAGKPLLVDPKRTRLADYRGATVVKPNLGELRRATGRACDTDDDARLAAEAVIAATGAAVLLTRSERGMSLFRDGAEPVHQPALARDVFDVSGAGDTVSAVVGLALAAGYDMVEAMRLANVAAGVVVGKRGTATVTIGELACAHAAAVQGYEAGIVDHAAAARQREAWRSQGLTVGFTNGCFDLIHPGHISLLQQARRACDRLIVALNSDRSVRRLKGPSRPVQGEEARSCVLAALSAVDLVTLFDSDTPRDLIAALKPDVLVKGADYTEGQVAGADLVRSWGGRVVLARLVPEHSTTRLVRRCGVDPGIEKDRLCIS